MSSSLKKVRFKSGLKLVDTSLTLPYIFFFYIVIPVIRLQISLPESCEFIKNTIKTKMCDLVICFNPPLSEKNTRKRFNNLIVLCKCKKKVGTVGVYKTMFVAHAE